MCYKQTQQHQLIYSINLFVYIKNYYSNMLNVDSPFATNIQECKLNMKKLRKKIYKYTSTHKQNKKPKDPVQDILGLLKPRDIPSFLMEPIKKRRNLDLSSLKSVMALPGATLQEITSRTNNQECEIQNLFKQHKLRMKSQRKPNTPKFDKKQTVSTVMTEKARLEKNEFDYSYNDQDEEYENFMNPEVSEFKILGNYEDDGHLDFFYHHDINFGGENLFEEEEF